MHHVYILLFDALRNIVDIFQVLTHSIEFHVGCFHKFAQLSPHGFDDDVHFPIHRLQVFAVALLKQNERAPIKLIKVIPDGLEEVVDFRVLFDDAGVALL